MQHKDNVIEDETKHCFRRESLCIKQPGTKILIVGQVQHKTGNLLIKYWKEIGMYGLLINYWQDLLIIFALNPEKEITLAA